MADLPKIVRQRLQAQPGETHPDADLLTGFAEKALGERERAQVLEHLAACAACREVVSLALPQEEGEAAAAPQGMRGWVLRWQTAAALAAVAVAAVALLTIPDSYFRSTHAPVQVAKTPAETTAAARQETSVAASSPAPTQADALKKQAESKNGLASSKKEAVAGGGLSGGAATVAEADRGRRDESKDKLSRSLPAAPTREAQVPTFGTEASRQAPPPPSGRTNEYKAGAAPVAPTDQAKTQAAGEEQKQAVGGLVQSPGVAQQASESGAAKVAATAAPAAADQAQVAGQAQTPVRAASETVEVSAAAIAPAPQWRTSPAGELERSQDAGRSWRTVNVGAGAKWHAVSAVGEHVWAGGHRQRAAVLYHSGDGGAHWARLEFTGPVGAQPVDIVALNFTDLQHGVMTVIAAEDTSLRQIWTTADGGHTWTAPPAR